MCTSERVLLSVDYIKLSPHGIKEDFLRVLIVAKKELEASRSFFFLLFPVLFFSPEYMRSRVLLAVLAFNSVGPI